MMKKIIQNKLFKINSYKLKRKHYKSGETQIHRREYPWRPMAARTSNTAIIEELVWGSTV